MDAAGLGDVVRGLLLREVGDVTGHGSRDDEGAVTLLLEDGADRLGAVRRAVEVRVDDLVPLLDGAVEHTVVGRGAGVGDEAVDAATEVVEYVLYELLDRGKVTDVALVCFGLNAVLLDQLLDVLLSTLLAGSVGDGHVGAELGYTAGGFDAHASGARRSGDDDDLALEAQEVEQFAGGRNWLRHLDDWWLSGIVVVGEIGKKGLPNLR